jgi:LysR family transcriptional regulator, hydrogen peroxide-inducible genes activator
MKRFTLTQIEYVLAVRRFGHFAKAAGACHVTQPTLSMQIQKLEDDLGLVIFDRSKKPVLLTKDGERVVAQMQTVLFEAQKLSDLVESNGTKGEGLSGHLRIGVIPTLAPFVLPGLLREMKNSHTEVKLSFSEMQTHAIVDALDRDEVDVGLLATPLGIPRVHEIPLFFEPFVAYFGADHLPRGTRVKQTDLTADGLWLLEEGHCLRNQVLDICALKKTRKGDSPYQFESGSLGTLINLVRDFGGYTLLPVLAMEDLEVGRGRDQKILPFERPIPAREVGFALRREHHKIDLIEALGDALVASLPDHIRKLRRRDLEVLPVEGAG